MTQRRRPTEIFPEIDEYDGHAGYRDRIREVASFKPLVWLGVLIGCGMWYAAGKLVLVTIDSGPDTDDFLAIFVYVICGGVGCFAYSPVEGAAANALPGQLPGHGGEERRARGMELRRPISGPRVQR